MVLYATDVSDFAITKTVSKKNDATEKQTEEKPKKEMSEKQKAALERGRIRRQEQKEAKLKAAKEEKAEKAKAQEEEELLHQKLLGAGKKRKAKVEPKKSPQPQLTPEATPEPLLKKPRRELKAKENEPPEWFKAYVENVQKEKAHTEGNVTKKQENIIKNEALKVAKKSWKSGLTRDLVQGEVNNHMDRMYSMIFGR